MRTNTFTRLAGAVMLAGAAAPALADQYHYNNMLIGDRASGMGGAYTAISDDPAGLFYNPAGIVYAGSGNLSASVNAIHNLNTSYEDVLGGNDWDRTSSTLLPNFFGVVQPFGGGVVGFSYAVTDSILEDQDQVFENFGSVQQYVINVNNTDNTYKVGPSYAVEIGDTLAVGTTMYLHIRRRETILNQWIRLVNNSDFEWSNNYFQTEETGINPVIGLMWSPFDKLSLGLSMRKTFILTSETRNQNTCASNVADHPVVQCLEDSTTGTPQDPAVAEFSDKRQLPAQITAGIAYFHSARLLLSSDFSYFPASNDFTLNREATWNAAFGAEYYIDNQWAARAGVFTNNANTPTIGPSSSNADEHIDFTGFSFSLTRFTRNSSVSGGFALQNGTGEAQIVGGTATQDVAATALTFFLSTNYSY